MTRDEALTHLRDAAHNGTLMTPKHDPGKLGTTYAEYRSVLSFELASNLENFINSGEFKIVEYQHAPYAASPLCAQPVVELCGRIPVDVHFDGGRIRGLARRAFAAEVAEPILRRQWKDRPLLQLGEVIALNLPFIREHLLEGRLVKERILNRVAVEQASTFGWARYTGSTGSILGMTTFGASAPLKVLQEAFGFTKAKVVTAAKAQLAVGS